MKRKIGFYFGFILTLLFYGCIFTSCISKQKNQQKYEAKVIIHLQWGTKKGEFGYANPDYFKGDIIHLLGGIGISPDGNIYIGDSSNKRVLVYDENGKFLKQIEVELENFVFLAVDKNSNLYVSYSFLSSPPENKHFTYIYNNEGKLIRKLPYCARADQDTWNNITGIRFHPKEKWNLFLYDYDTDTLTNIEETRTDEKGQRYITEYFDYLDKEGNYYVVSGGYKISKIEYSKKNPYGEYYIYEPLHIEKFSKNKQFMKKIVFSSKNDKYLPVQHIIGIDMFNNTYLLGISKDNIEKLAEDYRKVDRKCDTIIKIGPDGNIVSTINLIERYPYEYRFLVDRKGNIYHTNIRGKPGRDDLLLRGFKVIKYEPIAK